MFLFIIIFIDISEAKTKRETYFPLWLHINKNHRRTNFHIK